MVVETETLSKSNGTNNGGPRVSFNRDVHVKRYGLQLNHNDPLNYESITSRSQSPANLRRELPADLSDEALEREAALVLEQAKHFGSLPHRKNHRKPIRRSISDASSKKSKRNSIFNIFNSTPASTNSSPSPVNFKKSGTNANANKPVERSKSDVSSQSSSQNSKRDKRRDRIQLSSNSFSNSDSSDNNNNQFTTSTPKKKAPPLSPITEVNSPLSDVNTRTDYFDGLLDATTEKSQKLTNGTKGFASRDDLGAKPTSATTDKKMTSKYSKSMDSMHSSQMPAEKPALTKGAAVNSMIKRLSNDRFSPPPPQIIQAGGFSYTNPQLSPLSPQILLTSSPTKFNSPPRLTKKSDEPSRSDIVYAQVVCNELKNVNDGHKVIHSKETVHNTLKKNRQSASPPPNIKSNHIVDKFKTDSVENSVINTAKSPPPTTAAAGNNYQYRNSVKIFTDYDQHDEVDNNANALTTGDEEPIIKPNIRYHIPRYSSTTIINNDYDNKNNHFQPNNEFNHHEMRDTDFNGIDMNLRNRREILESRIKSRIGGLQHTNDNDTTNTTRRSSSSPPTTKLFHKYGSNEIINRYSPERTHLDLVHSPSPSYEHGGSSSKSKSYVDSTTRKKSHYYTKSDKVDSGVDADNVSRNNRKNKNNSRFNIGRKWNYEDDIIECELFLMKERKHTEETYPFQLVRTYVYRERSIDDGSHYDPNLDKTNIIKEWKRNDKITKDFLKTKKKKKSGIEMVKDLFKSKSKSNSPNDVDDSEVRSRYREYSPVLEPPPPLNANQQDIASRRRMSTPTASPVITSRSKSLPPKDGKRTSITTTSTSTLKRDKENNAHKFNWFTSLDRLAKKKSREPSIATDEKSSSRISRTKSTSMKNISTNSNVGSGSNKTLRFFGDTDADDGTISKGSSKHFTALQEEARIKSSSMQNLNTNRKVKQNNKSISRSRAELQDISESTSDTECNGNDGTARRPASPTNYLKTLPPPRPPKSKMINPVSTLPKPPRRKMFDDNDMDREFNHRDVSESMAFYQKKDSFESDSLANLSSARKLRENLSVSRENLHRERFDSDASQRSIVFLHATTIGAIPSQTLGRSRTGKNSIKSSVQEEEPMMRTVNRSVSLNAPWKPKFISDGYEINYSNEQQMKNRYHQNTIKDEMSNKSASREKLAETSRQTRPRWNRDSSKRI